MQQALRLHGLDLSYFTGKLEAYLRVKGIPFRFVAMDTAGFRRAARATGYAQMPALEWPGGRWMTDTTAIIAWFEANADGPRLHSPDPAARFLARLLEDMFDEWLWRPALYYRWAFDDDARLISSRIARTMLRDVPLPFWLRRQYILRRQRRVYLRGDGVTAANAGAIAQLYHDVLAMLEPIVRARPFLFGARPCEADFGLFGSMFRHFASDPTPAAIMRAEAPAVSAWVARLWALTPGDVAAAPDLGRLPADLAPLFAMAAGEYLPYLAANARALAGGERTVTYADRGAMFTVPVSPYRAGCLAALATDCAGLDGKAGAEATEALGPDVVGMLVAAARSVPATPSAAALRDRHGIPLSGWLRA